MFLSQILLFEYLNVVERCVIYILNQKSEISSFYKQNYYLNIGNDFVMSMKTKVNRCNVTKNIYQL